MRVNLLLMRGTIGRAGAGISRPMRWSTLQTDSLLRQALIDNGLRQAAPRIAHLICEVRARLQAVDEPVAPGFDWPLTQDDLADVTGMTPVHANRSLRILCDIGLTMLDRRRVHVPDPDHLAAFCEFRPDYLHRAHAPSDPVR